jgi:hypothetical protein
MRIPAAVGLAMPDGGFAKMLQAYLSLCRRVLEADDLSNPVDVGHELERLRGDALSTDPSGFEVISSFATLIDDLWKHCNAIVHYFKRRQRFAENGRKWPDAWWETYIAGSEGRRERAKTPLRNLQLVQDRLQQRADTADSASSARFSTVNDPVPCGQFASASDIARMTGSSAAAVESKLRRLRTKLPDCFVEMDSPRKNEPRFLYRVDAVMSHLQQRGDGRTTDGK